MWDHGEGVLLTLDERRRVAELFREACDGILVVHAGAQTTRDTVQLARHARELGADGVGVIPPPYYPLDDDALVEHLCAAAAAVRHSTCTCTHSRPAAGIPCRSR